MPDRNVFRVASPLGYTVVLTRNRWREIVKFKHPAVGKLQSQVKQCIAQPELVRASAKDSDVHLHYLQIASRKHLCVVTGPSEADERFVITAYITARPKQGFDLWKK